MELAKQSKYEFINKTLFFPEEGILAVGDLHIGYEQSLIESGVLMPEQQVKEIIKELKEIFDKIEARGWQLKKIIFLGDIKDMFSFHKQEKANFWSIIDFLNDKIREENIIIVKGNHDTSELGLKIKNYHIESDIAFLHGHQSFSEIFDKKINFLVSGHLHPSILLEENPGVKSESYKCFLVGETKNKTFIIVPSFLGFVEGTPVNNYRDYYVESFSIIPKKDILNAQVFVIGEDKIYNFGKIRDLD